MADNVTPMSKRRISLLSSQAILQAPWVEVTIGKYTFGRYSKIGNIYRYPEYIQSLTVEKINGQINKYTLVFSYPITDRDDPNFFEKVFSSVSQTRKITFTYGDATQPKYVYKNEEGIITNVSQSFDFHHSSSITYTVDAVSSATLAQSGNYTFTETNRKPSDIIKEMFMNPYYGLRNIFTGMSNSDLDTFIAGDDKVVALEPKVNISALDYISYLVSCMLPEGSDATNNLSNDIYILTIKDGTIYDRLYGDEAENNGPTFKVTKVSSLIESSDAYNIDIGYNTSVLVRDFQIQNNYNYSLYFDYQQELNPQKYKRVLQSNGKWEEIFAPSITSNNELLKTRPNDITWWSKVTQFPITASITIQGLLRPAVLMTHVRLNVIFPGGHKHQSSGLYIVTKQTDYISGSGYATQLNLVRIAGDVSPTEDPFNL